MADPDLCTSADVAALLLRPLTDAETTSIEGATGLIAKASDLLRNAVPSIDDRIARYAIDQKDKGAVSPMTVATVLAGVIKRYIRNPDGLASQNAGPFGKSYALRGDKAPRGVLEITPDDVKALFPSRKRPQAGTIRTRPALAPRPVGRYGPLPGPGEAAAAEVEWNERPDMRTAQVLPLDALYNPGGST